MQANSVASALQLNSYYQRLITVVLIVAYAMLHVQLTGVYDQATPQLYYEGLVRLPYGQRMLVPLLARGLGYLLPLKPEPLFFIWEIVFVALSYWAMNLLLQCYFNQRQAIALTWLLLLILPLVFVVNYRLLSNDKSTIYYPCDTATVFFMALGLYLCLQKSWRWLMPVVAIATVNRETGLLLALLIPCLYWQKPVKQWLPAFISAVIAFILAKLFVIWMVSDLTGSYTEWYYRGYDVTIFYANFYYLTQKYGLFFYCYAFACLPIFIFAFYDYIPYQFRPIRWLCLAYFLGLFMVGHALEARIYGEIVTLLYLPTVVAIQAWLNHKQLLPYQRFHLPTIIDRYGILVILGMLVLFRSPLNLLVIKVSEHLS